MELVSFSVPRSADKLVIAPLGDIQWSGPAGPTAQDSLKRHIDLCLELDAFFVGTGDYIDFMSPSNRRRLINADLYDTAKDVVWQKALDLTEEVYEKFLAPTKGRWMGLVEGHHFSEHEGLHTDEILADKLGAKFLGTSAFIRVPTADFVIYVHHGMGGGVLPGSGMNKLYHLAAGLQGAEVYLMGHNCLPTTARILTRRGYKRHDEVFVGEDVLAYDHESGENRWTPLLDVTTYGNAPLVDVRSKSFRVVQTPQHRWAVQDYAGRRSVRPLEECASNDDIIVSASAEGGDSTITPREAAIIGWIVTDGSTHVKNGISYHQIGQKKEPYKSEIRNLLEEDATEHKHKRHDGMSYFYVRRRLSRQLEIKGFQSREDLPRLVTSLSVEARKAMLHAMVCAEGDGVREFSQQAGPVLDAFNILTALEGIRCGVAAVATTQPRIAINGVPVNLTRPTYRKKMLRRSGPVSTQYLKITPAGFGEVWCPTTKYGTWVAEMDGNTFITGNTKLTTARLSRPFPKWGKRDSEHELEHRDIHIVNCGGFSKSNIVHHTTGGRPRGDYAEQGMMTPSPLTAPIITVDLKTKDRTHRTRVSI